MSERSPEEIIREHMRELGRRGGAARAAALGPEKTRAAALKASRAASRKAAKARAAKRKKKVENLP
ncbi:MAG TPA: hypothetical protein PK308_09095 [Phycisphaerales bacterium]|nr:hypothetical protein [Phycisphaerales bacterium]